MFLHSGKQASTDRSKLEKGKANSKSTASHVTSPIVHFGSHPFSDCQRSEHMALKVAFPPHFPKPWSLLVCFSFPFSFEEDLKCWHFVQGHTYIQTLI